MASPASTKEALEMILHGLGYLATTDPAAMAVQSQAECLQTLEQLDAVETAARARILAAFTAGQGYAEDADFSPTSWLIHRTRITKGAARRHLGWAAATSPTPRSWRRWPRVLSCPGRWPASSAVGPTSYPSSAARRRTRY